MKKYLIITLSLVAVVIALLAISAEYDTALPGQVMPAAVILLCVMLFKNHEIKEQ